MPLQVRAERLTSDSFAPFGQVLGPGLGSSRLIRDGAVQLTRTPPCLEHADEACTASVDIYVVAGETAPVECSCIERHPLSAQLFVPMTSGRWLVAVWPEGPAGPVRSFVAESGQGIVYARGLWHQGIVALDQEVTFLSMMFRGEDTKDTVFETLSRPVSIETPQG